MMATAAPILSSDPKSLEKPFGRCETEGKINIVNKNIVYEIRSDLRVMRSMIAFNGSWRKTCWSYEAGRYIYFESERRLLYVNSQWTSNCEQSNTTQYPSHRSHTPCRFAMVKKIEPVKENWNKLLLTLKDTEMKRQQNEHDWTIRL